jgi:hypothetical protein
LDIVVLRPEADEEDIQYALVNYDSDRFYLTSPRDRTADFNKLMYRIPGTSSVIKIDLLLSTVPELEIPSTFHRNHFVYINGLAVAPLYFVLYHKLLGWQDRVYHHKRWKRDQADGKDYDDIIELCAILRRQRIFPLSKAHMGRAYLDNFSSRAEDFSSSYNGEGPSRFRAIGFDV